MTPSENRSLYRILDAAANRCREGLRVVEEHVRFHRNDAWLTEQLKSLRHELTAALQALKLVEHLDCRDTPGDVGTTITLPSERKRESLQAVLQANLKRVEESLRVLEEYSKVIAPTASAIFESLRYRVYEVEKQLLLSSIHPLRLQKLQQSSLYLLVTEANCRNSLEQTVREAVAGGVGIVQLREKQETDRVLLEKARHICQITQEAGALFVMNDRPDLALLCGADGVHVGQEELTVAQVRQVVGPDMLIGVSTHSLAQAVQAEAEQADYLGVGPVFPSGTKAFSAYVGVSLLQQVAEEINTPWFAIGGLEMANAEAVRQAGARRIAVSQVVCQTADPRGTAEKLRKIFPELGTKD